MTTKKATPAPLPPHTWMKHRFAGSLNAHWFYLTRKDDGKPLGNGGPTLKKARENARESIQAAQKP